jgi:hypothetical protein
MLYIRNKALEFVASGSGYWGNHDFGLERAIRTPKETSIFLGGAAEKLISMIASGQLLLNWKMSNLRGSTVDLLHFAETYMRSMNGSAVDLIAAAITTHGNSNGFTSMPPSSASIQRLVPIDVGMSRVALNDPRALVPNMLNDPRVLVPNMSFMHNMSNMPYMSRNKRSSDSYESSLAYERNKPDMYYNMTRFRKEAKSTVGRFNSFGASFVDIDRFPSNMAGYPSARMDEDDNMSTVSSTDEFSHLPRDDGNGLSSNEFRASGGAANDSFLSSSSKIIRRVKRKLEDKPADETPVQQAAPTYKSAAKGIQITPVGTFRVQLNKTKNSSRKFTKNVNDIVDALWLFEIAVLICDKPIELSCLLKSGNYQYLLEKNYIRDIEEYKAKLFEYILILHKKKILKSDLAEAAAAIFSNITVDDSNKQTEQVVDPVDLHNLLSLKG